MNTFATIEEAREYAKAQQISPYLGKIIEIDHAADGRCYFVCKATMTIMARALAAKPIPEIERLVAEHDILSPAEKAAESDAALAAAKAACKCEECGKHVDMDSAYHQDEWYRGMKCRTYYCDACRYKIDQHGDGEVDITERAARPSNKPSAEYSHPTDY